MKDISFKKAIAGMIVFFVIGFAAGWFAWYAFVPVHSTSSDPGWSGTSSSGASAGTGQTGAATSSGTSSTNSSSGGW